MKYYKCEWRITKEDCDDTNPDIETGFVLVLEENTKLWRLAARCVALLSDRKTSSLESTGRIKACAALLKSRLEISLEQYTAIKSVFGNCGQIWEGSTPVDGDLLASIEWNVEYEIDELLGDAMRLRDRELVYHLARYYTLPIDKYEYLKRNGVLAACQRAMDDRGSEITERIATSLANPIKWTGCLLADQTIAAHWWRANLLGNKYPFVVQAMRNAIDRVLL